jgi:hypothetical protein
MVDLWRYSPVDFRFRDRHSLTSIVVQLKPTCAPDQKVWFGDRSAYASLLLVPSLTIDSPNSVLPSFHASSNHVTVKPACVGQPMLWCGLQGCCIHAADARSCWILIAAPEARLTFGIAGDAGASELRETLRQEQPRNNSPHRFS